MPQGEFVLIVRGIGWRRQKAGEAPSP
jgi:hypothetical protein